MTSTSNGIKLGPRARALVRSAARLINPLVLLIAGRRWMPVLGVLHHRGRRSGRMYGTPLGMRPLGSAFVIPRTFGENAAWYLNVRAAGWAIATYRGRDYTLIGPEVVDYATAAPAFPRYELLQFRLVGINEYLRLQQAPAGWSRAEPRRTRDAATPKSDEVFRWCAR
jgi:deazaflavin-dependent oxidoreductase (nitroreductase family)